MLHLGKKSISSELLDNMKLDNRLINIEEIDRFGWYKNAECFRNNNIVLPSCQRYRLHQNFGSVRTSKKILNFVE